MSDPRTDSATFPSGRIEANGSLTGPNTFTTFPTGRFRLSTTRVPYVGANWARTRTEPSYATFSTTPNRLMPPTSAVAA